MTLPEKLVDDTVKVFEDVFNTISVKDLFSNFFNNYGYPIVVLELLPDTRKEKVKRTIRERLFTIPWQPFKKEKEIDVPFIITELGGNKIYMSQKVFDQLKNNIGDVLYQDIWR